ncbi:hypothetical protein [Ignatzschineria cameli]|uniref:hypothetical protein n=1 Tax=Ignatzschineria cameli TaxID=2182793 RepID=UPI001057F439|nr:hypothetical protein [Ignatzschineria cameli]
MPEITIACFHKPHAGKYRSFNDIVPVSKMPNGGHAVAKERNLHGIKDANRWACSGEKNETVSSRRSTISFKNHLSQQKSLNAAGPHYRVLPSITRRQLAILIAGKYPYFNNKMILKIIRNFTSLVLI